MNRRELDAVASTHGLDLLRYTTSERLEAAVESGQKPSDISEYLPGFIVVAKRIPTGVMGAADGEPKPLALGIVHRALEEAVAGLAYALEAADFMAVAVPPLAMDFTTTDELALTPAGQASPLLRQAAVTAGLGTLGLNRMLLTPEFGPRVLLGGLMTSLELEPDAPLADPLCPGLEGCGRCAAVCPARAIPLRAPAGAPLDEVRNLDEAACAEWSQPRGVRDFTRQIRELVREEEPARAAARIDGPAAARLWYHMTFLRQGAFSGCTRCLQVCPVGTDFAGLQHSPFRQQDLPVDFQPERTAEHVVVEWVGGRDSIKEQG